MKLSNKTLAILLSVLMVLSACLLPGAVAFAEDPAVIGSGECGKDGNNLTWTLTSDGVITISGEGEMADFVSYEDPETHETVSVRAPWAECATDILVTRLGYESVDELEQAIMSGTADMGAYMNAAMEYDTFFKKAVIGEGVTSIGAQAFDYLHLEEVSLPTTITSIGMRAFSGCGLTALALPEGVKVIGASAFDNNDFEEFTVPASVESVEYDIFSGCEKLKTLTWLSNASLDYLALPSVPSDFPFTTYSAYSAYDTYYSMQELLMELLSRDYNTAMAIPQYMYYYNMTAEQARSFVENIYNVEMFAETTEYGVPAGATDEQAYAILVAKINEILGTTFTTDTMFTCVPALATSPELFTDVYLHGYSQLMTLLTSYYPMLKALKTDRTTFKTKTGKTDVEIDEGLPTLYAELAVNFNITAASIDEAITGIIAYVNTTLGKTGDNAYTEATLGNICWVCAEPTDAVKTAVMQKFNLDSYPGYISITSGYIGGQSLVPWFTIRINCDHTSIGYLAENEVSYEVIHTIVEHTAQAPTCVDKGWDAYETCSKCDYTTYGGEIGATGIHTPVVVNAREATATEDGYTGDTICSVCQAPLAAGEVIPATGAQEDPGDQPSGGENLCKWCSEPHNGFFGKLVGFFHSILYFFAHLFGKR